MINTIKNNVPVLLGVTAAFSALGGAAVGFTVAAKRLEAKYAQMAQDDIDAMKQHYKLLYKEDEYREIPVSDIGADLPQDDDLKAVAESIIEKMEYAEAPDYDEVVVVKEESVNSNVFESEDSEIPFDADAEAEKREKGEPYILTQDEFLNNATEYQQITITFYEGDEVLADDQDQLMNNIDSSVGYSNLRFGYGSKDKRVVYIANPKLEVDFEVLQSQGNYTEEVLGFVQHIEDRHPPRIRKFRGDDG